MSPGAADRREDDAAPRRPSRALLRFFDTYLGFFFPRHFHALRLAGAERWQAAGRPLIVCLNHPSWWDPLTAILLSRSVARELDHYAPIDAVAARRYGVLGRLGLFPVEQGTARGAAQFLRAAKAVLAQPRAVLWLTPQGVFTDVRQRPLALRGGLGALLRRLPEATVLPLALEYTFWDERLPEALALFGEPLHLRHGLDAHGRDAEGSVTAAMADTQDALAALALRRDPRCFPALVLAGGAGTSGIYGAWQRLTAALRGRTWQPDHGSLHAGSRAEAVPRRP